MRDTDGEMGRNGTGRVRPGAALLAAVLAWACAPVYESPGEADAGRVPEPGLVASLQVETGADSVRFALRVTNATGEPVALTFPTGQSYDFVVEQAGRELWRWSEGMMFTQAIRMETLEPEETRAYTESWQPPAGADGELAVRGWLTAQEFRLEQRTPFRLP